MASTSIAGPGFVNFVLSDAWLAARVDAMLRDGIATWAPQLPVCDEAAMLEHVCRSDGSNSHLQIAYSASGSSPAPGFSITQIPVVQGIASVVSTVRAHRLHP